MEDEKPSEEGGNMSTFSADLEFLNFETNEDSLDLSLSEGGFQGGGSGILSSVASGESSEWSPSSFSSSNVDFDVTRDILGDLHLPSLGNSGTARKILTQLLHENDRAESRGMHVETDVVTGQQYAKEGHMALQHMNDDIKYTREHSAALQVELTHVKKQQLATRDELHDLDIGENLYVQLQKLSPDEMTLREYACLRAASVYMPLRKQVQDLERNLHEVQVQLELNNSTLESQASELSRQRKLSSSMQESHRLDLLAAEERGDRLSTRVQAEIVKRQEREAQAARCDDALADAEALRKEATVLRNTVDEQSRMLETLTTNDRNHHDQLADMTKAKEMLAMDKAYLQRELGEVTSVAHEHSRKVDSQQMHIEKLDAKILELTDQLVNVQMSTRTAFDERMEKEVNRLRLDYDKDMNSIKDTSKEISDHENRILREMRVNLEKELETVRSKLSDKEHEVNSLTRELADNRTSSECEVSMLRAEIKMKHFEVTSLGATFEERSSQLKIAQLDLDVLREEVSVHKTALLKMESENENKCRRLEEDLSRAYDTIHAYDVLFSDDSHNDNDTMLKDQYRGTSTRGSSGNGIDFDKSTLSVGSTGGRRRLRSDSNAAEDLYSDDDWENDEEDPVSANDKRDQVKTEDGGRGSFNLESSRFTSRGKSSRKHSISVLISNPRKFRQLLDSSERNIETIEKQSQQILELKARINDLLKEKKKMKEEISNNIRELSLVPKSNKHIIDLYSQKDDECRLLHMKVASLEKDANDYRKNIEEYAKKNSALKDQLNVLVEERKELGELKNLLIEFHQQTGEESSYFVEDDARSISKGDVSSNKVENRNFPQESLMSAPTFTEEQIKSPVFRDSPMDEYETQDIANEFIKNDHEITDLQEDLPSVNNDSLALSDDAPLITSVVQSTPPPSKSVVSTPKTSDKLAGLSPMVLKTMVERNTSSTPVRAQQHTGDSKPVSPDKKIGFHMRSPAGK